MVASYYQWMSISKQTVFFTFHSILDNHQQMDQKGHRSLDLTALVVEKKMTVVAQPSERVR